MDVVAAAVEWIAHDPDEQDRRALQALVDRADDPQARAELDQAMGDRLVFGTAGLRGRMGPGPNRMNTATVTTATAGLCAVLTESIDRPRIVIGYDARHRSAEFARTAAGVATAAGCEVLMMPLALPTPLLAFAVQRLAADAGIMITASHNPAPDNGYKVYLGGHTVSAAERGAQLVSPTDEMVMASIEAAGWADEIPVSDGWTVLGEEIVEEYLAAAHELAARFGATTTALAGLRVVLTAMHGVGYAVAAGLLEQFGATVLPVEAQREPDPDFPTVAFPNPEEPGALDLALDLARTEAADLVVALDPDADRCAFAVPDRFGHWRQLTGDEVGSLLAWFLADHLPSSADRPPVFARSIVSGSMIDAIGAAHGIPVHQTLTGFKWIARAPGMVFGYEEAIGYCLNPDAVRDKDGITAGLVGCLMVAESRAGDRTIDEVLDELDLSHGLHLTAPLTFRVDDLSLIQAGLARLASAPPETLGGFPVTQVVDLENGYLGLASTPGHRIENEQGDRVVVRPSGTEPKLKCYLEVRQPVASRDQLEPARAIATARLELIREDLTRVLGL